MVSVPHGITPPWGSLPHQHPSVLYELCQSLRGEHNHVLVGGELVFQSDYWDSSQFVLCVLRTSEYLLSANEATYGNVRETPFWSFLSQGQIRITAVVGKGASVHRPFLPTLSPT